METHPLERAPGQSRELLAQSLPLLPSIAEVCLKKPMKAFNGRTVAQCVDPQKVSPFELAKLEKKGGDALYSSTHWANTEGLRITALTGYRSAVSPSESERYWKKQEELMLLLGGIPPQEVMKRMERRAEIYA
jgi:hypothetical protein